MMVCCRKEEEGSSSPQTSGFLSLPLGRKHQRAPLSGGRALRRFYHPLLRLSCVVKALTRQHLCRRSTLDCAPARPSLLPTSCHGMPTSSTFPLLAAGVGLSWQRGMMPKSWHPQAAGRRSASLCRSSSGSRSVIRCPISHSSPLGLTLLRGALQMKGLLGLDPLPGPLALVLAPTREVAQQTARAARGMRSFLKLRTVTLFGGAPKKEQAALLAKSPHLLVASPGRLLDMVEEGLVSLGGPPLPNGLSLSEGGIHCPKVGCSSRLRVWMEGCWGSFGRKDNSHCVPRVP